ncbi:MAG TPA: hypothetical protein PKX23_02165 [Verrucomicrobiota bacterium]|jgi:hypothetical protein|nr:hypothetical protein [Verrucomicrobiota bacterium]HRT07113.1 hypothetical protein [Candidatus Paceibacterota bacterium]HRT56185.1 hypothetical protein [Candidatus Paceibacterota bacterium]
MMLFALVSVLAAEPTAPDAALKQIVAAVAQAARENAARPEKERVAGDALTDFYVRRACQTGLPGRTIVLGLAYALDPTASLAANPLAAARFKEVETAEERTARLAALGSPTLRGRQDWLAHFVVSAGLAVTLGEPAAELLGLQKEVSDARGKEQGAGSGFSFADLNANFAGMAFARLLMGPQGKAAAAEAARRFKTLDFVPDPGNLPEGLTWTDFESRWGGLADPRFQRECEQIRQRVRECPGYRKWTVGRAEAS